MDFSESEVMDKDDGLFFRVVFPCLYRRCKFMFMYTQKYEVIEFRGVSLQHFINRKVLCGVYVGITMATFKALGKSMSVEEKVTVLVVMLYEFSKTIT